jgi:hypothetical protein
MSAVATRHAPHIRTWHIAHDGIALSQAMEALLQEYPCRWSGSFAVDSYVKPASLFSSVQRCAQLIYGQGRTKQTQKSMSLWRKCAEHVRWEGWQAGRPVCIHPQLEDLTDRHEAWRLIARTGKKRPDSGTTASPRRASTAAHV